MRDSLRCCVILAALLGCCQAYSSFRSQIPNGDSVPNTCTTDTADGWNGVGHVSVSGGGSRNPFGLAYNAAGNAWTAELCAADSDNDGVTNGAELGDPNCTWQSGGAAPSESATGHPGICEPVTSDACKTENSWVTDCPAQDVVTNAPTNAPTDTTNNSPTGDSSSDSPTSQDTTTSGGVNDDGGENGSPLMVAHLIYSFVMALIVSLV